MKKLILLLICLLPVIVKADYSVTNYRINMTILENGDVEVIEAFSMSGLYNGFEKNINYKNIYDNYSKSSLSSVENKDLYDGKSIILNEIRSIDFSNELEFTELINNSYLFEINESAKKGDYGFYNHIETSDGIIYKIYNPSMLNKDFYISYTIEDLVISHEDISELAISILKDNEQNIDNLEITINIPNNKDVLKLWVHGQEGIVESSNNQNLKITINNIAKNEDLDFRLVFDSIIFGKNTNETVLEKIINIEDNFNETIEDIEYEKLKENAYNAVEKVKLTYSKEDYNSAVIEVEKLNEDDFKTNLLIKLIELESKVERRYTIIKVFFTSVMGILIIGLLITLYYIYTKYENKYIKYKEKYYKEIPDYKSYVVSFLLNRKVTKKDLFATVFYLINTNKIGLKKTKKDYKLIKLSTENLSFSEERCIKFLFNREDETTFENMKKRAKKYYNRFLHKYSNWLNATTYEGNLKELFEDLIYIKIFGISYCLVAIVICVLTLNKPTYFSPIIVMIISIIFLIYFILFYKRTKKGKECYYKYKAFKRYLKNEKITDNIESYLPYAISFGCENKIIKDNKYDIKDFINLKNAINEALNIAYKMKK